MNLPKAMLLELETRLSESTATPDMVFPTHTDQTHSLRRPNMGQRSMLQFYVTGSKGLWSKDIRQAGVPDVAEVPVHFQSRVLGTFSSQHTQALPGDPHPAKSRLLDAPSDETVRPTTASERQGLCGWVKHNHRWCHGNS